MHDWDEATSVTIDSGSVESFTTIFGKTADDVCKTVSFIIFWSVICLAYDLVVKRRWLDDVSLVDLMLLIENVNRHLEFVSPQ